VLLRQLSDTLACCCAACVQPFKAAGAALAAAAKSYKLKAVDVDLRHLPDVAPDLVTSFVVGAVTGLYEGNVRYRSKPEPKAQLQTMQLLVEPSQQAALGAAASRGAALAQGTLMARQVPAV